MNLRRFKVSLPLLVALISAVAAAQAPRLKQVADVKLTAQQEIVKRARQSYYSLRASGLDEFQSTVKPNWEVVLHDALQADPKQAQAALDLLNELHFSMLLDKNGKVTVSHRADIDPPNEQVRQGFEQIYSGLDQAVPGFFATWSLFMLTSPFPAVEGDYLVDDLGSQYRLTYKDGDSDVVTLMGKDMVITEIKVTSREFVSTIKPKLVKSDKGFLLTGYVGDYKPNSGPGVVHLDVKIQHGPVNGLQLPVILVADSVLDGAPTHMELAFSEFQVKAH